MVFKAGTIYCLTLYRKGLLPAPQVKTMDWSIKGLTRKVRCRKGGLTWGWRDLPNLVGVLRRRLATEKGWGWGCFPHPDVRRALAPLSLVLGTTVWEMCCVTLALSPTLFDPVFPQHRSQTRGPALEALKTLGESKPPLSLRAGWGCSPHKQRTRVVPFPSSQHSPVF